MAAPPPIRVGVSVMKGRPPRSDEHARIGWWREQLDRHHPTKEDVVHAAASALAMRDKHIVDLEARLLEQVTSPRRRTKALGHG